MSSFRSAPRGEGKTRARSFGFRASSCRRSTCEAVLERSTRRRDARVFADGYYVGIVNDFDGVFQHVNLEAGPHHMEIEMGGAQGIEFDVYVRPGETTTFRADRY